MLRLKNACNGEQHSSGGFGLVVCCSSLEVKVRESVAKVAGPMEEIWWAVDLAPETVGGRSRGKTRTAGSTALV